MIAFMLNKNTWKNIIYYSLISIVVILPWFSNLYASSECGDVFRTERVGPFDYTDPFNHTQESMPGSRFTSRIHVVESAHFTPDVESLRSGNTGSIMQDLTYTLTVFPNHHRALWAMVKYEKKNKGNLPQIHENDFPETAECFLKRAINFRPEDMTVRQIYGNHLFMQKEYKKALEQYRIVESKLSETGELAYNMGLTYFELGDYKLAKEYAEKAENSGFPLKGLQKKIDRKEKQ